jgi:hypothetical protein
MPRSKAAAGYASNQLHGFAAGRTPALGEGYRIYGDHAAVAATVVRMPCDLQCWGSAECYCRGPIRDIH